jgi:hypothetical protein
MQASDGNSRGDRRTIIQTIMVKLDTASLADKR